ncbi:Leucine-rich repeat containing protein [Entamoeba marina]
MFLHSFGTMRQPLQTEVLQLIYKYCDCECLQTLLLINKKCCMIVKLMERNNCIISEYDNTIALNKTTRCLQLQKELECCSNCKELEIYGDLIDIFYVQTLRFNKLIIKNMDSFNEFILKQIGRQKVIKLNVVLYDKINLGKYTSLSSCSIHYMNSNIDLFTVFPRRLQHLDYLFIRVDETIENYDHLIHFFKTIHKYINFRKVVLHSKSRQFDNVHVDLLRRIITIPNIYNLVTLCTDEWDDDLCKYIIVVPWLNNEFHMRSTSKYIKTFMKAYYPSNLLITYYHQLEPKVINLSSYTQLQSISTEAMNVLYYLPTSLKYYYGPPPFDIENLEIDNLNLIETDNITELHPLVTRLKIETNLDEKIDSCVYTLNVKYTLQPIHFFTSITQLIISHINTRPSYSVLEHLTALKHLEFRHCKFPQPTKNILCPTMVEHLTMINSVNFMSFPRHLKSLFLFDFPITPNFTVFKSLTSLTYSHSIPVFKDITIPSSLCNLTIRNVVCKNPSIYQVSQHLQSVELQKCWFTSLLLPSQLKLLSLQWSKVIVTNSTVVHTDKIIMLMDDYESSLLSGKIHYNTFLRFSNDELKLFEEQNTNDVILYK